MVVGIGTEFIENHKEGVSKQDCEQTSFKRWAETMKKEYLRMLICLLSDTCMNLP